MWKFSLFQVGQREQFILGQWLGERYRTLFGNVYSEMNIHIVSSSKSRAIVSAKRTIHGIYSNLGNGTESLVDIEVIAEKEDNVVSDTKPCKKQDELRKEVIKSKSFSSKLDYELYEYLRNVTKMPVYDFSIAFFMYDSLEAEAKQNLTLPDWSKHVYPDKMKEQAINYVLLKTFTDELKRLQVGFFWYKITSFLKDFISNPHNSPKVFFISGHQHNLVNILVSLGDFDYYLPSYSSSIIFELRQKNGKNYYIQVYLKNETSLKNVKIKNCGRKCHVFEFFKILEPITTDQKQWEYECNPGDSTITTIIICLLIAGLLFICGIIYWTSRISKRKFNLIKEVH